MIQTLATLARILFACGATILIGSGIALVPWPQTIPIAAMTIGLAALDIVIIRRMLRTTSDRRALFADILASSTAATIIIAACALRIIQGTADGVDAIMIGISLWFAWRVFAARRHLIAGTFPKRIGAIEDSRRMLRDARAAWSDQPPKA